MIGIWFGTIDGSAPGLTWEKENLTSCNLDCSNCHKQRDLGLTTQQRTDFSGSVNVNVEASWAQMTVISIMSAVRYEHMFHPRTLHVYDARKRIH